MKPCARCSVSAVCFAEPYEPGPKNAAQAIPWLGPQAQVTLEYEDGTFTTIQVPEWFARFLSKRPRDCPRICHASVCEMPVRRFVCSSRRG